MTLSGDKFDGKSTRTEQQVFYCFPKRVIIMCKIFGKMSYEVHERLPGLDVFLAAIRTIAFVNDLSAIFTGAVLTERMFAHIDVADLQGC